MGASGNASGAWVEAPSPGLAYGLEATATFDSNAILCANPPVGCKAQRYPDVPVLIPPNHPTNKQWDALSSAAVVNHTLDFIDNITDGRPWYVNAWFHVAHASLDPTPDQLAQVPVQRACKSLSPNSGQTTCPNQIYWAAMLDADTQFGRLISALKSRGKTFENTVVAFSADNGPEVPESYPNSVGTTGPFRGKKRSLYDGGKLKHCHSCLRCY